MSWLLRDDDVLAAVEERRPGWQAPVQGVVILRGPALVQTLTPSHARALDVAWCAPAERAGDGRTWRVRRIAHVRPYRVSVPHLRGGGLVVAPGGTFERWQLKVGDRLEVCRA
jgi:hypothetical protein